MTRNNNDKLRAVLLAALMVLWVFAGTVAFAGSAAADLEEYDTEDVAISGVANTDGGTFYQGQVAQIDLTNTPGIGPNEVGDTVQIREVTDRDGGEISNTGLRTTSTIREDDNDNIFINIRTSQLDQGDYTLRYDGSFANASKNEFDGTGSDIAEWEVTLQTIDAEFEDETVRNNGNVSFSLESNRGNYNVTVSEADGNLDEEELERIFSNLESDTVDSITQDSEDEEITLEGVDSFIDEEDLTFSDIDQGEYTFDFEVDDSSAESSASITVNEELDGEVNFADAQVTATRGDVVEIDFESQGLEEDDEFTLTIGDEEDVGYEANMTVVLDDDEEATVEMNTWLAGNRTGDADGENATFVSSDSDVTDDTVNLNSDMLSDVIGAGDYDMYVEVEGEETDVATLNLVEPERNAHNIWTAPNSEYQSPGDGELELEDIQELADDGKLTQSNTIAIADEDRSGARNGDLVIHELDATGVFGAIEALGAENATDLNGQINVSYEQTNPTANEDAAELNSTDALKIVTDQENGTVYLVADSDDLSYDQGSTLDEEIHVDQEYEADVEFAVAYLEQFTRDDLEVDEDEESVTADLEFVDRELTFDTVDDNVTVAPTEDAEITGSTTVAPGTELGVRSRATGDNAFLRTFDADVTEDRTFTSTFDFSDVPAGTEFTASVRQQSFDENAETDGIVSEDTGEPTPEPTPEPTDEPTDEPTEEPEDQAGFGAVIALIALIGAALLAARRNAFN